MKQNKINQKSSAYEHPVFLIAKFVNTFFYLAYVLACLSNTKWLNLHVLMFESSTLFHCSKYSFFSFCRYHIVGLLLLLWFCTIS